MRRECLYFHLYLVKEAQNYLYYSPWLMFTDFVSNFMVNQQDLVSPFILVQPGMEYNNLDIIFSSIGNE